MACCILIVIDIKDELSYNSFNANIDRIYRINWVAKEGLLITAFNLRQRTGEMESVKSGADGGISSGKKLAK